MTKKEQILATYDGKLSDSEIATIVGCHSGYVNWTRRQARLAAGSNTVSYGAPPPPKMSLSEKERAAFALWKSGLSYSKIAERLGCSREAVAGACYRAKLFLERTKAAA